MSYNFNSYVNKGEADALKEMIFKRAQERSKAYTDDVQSDVMDLARESFVSNGNPFSKIVEKSITNYATVSAVNVAEIYCKGSTYTSNYSKYNDRGKSNT